MFSSSHVNGLVQVNLATDLLKTHRKAAFVAKVNPIASILGTMQGHVPQNDFSAKIDLGQC